MYLTFSYFSYFVHFGVSIGGPCGGCAKQKDFFSHFSFFLRRLFKTLWVIASAFPACDFAA